MERPNSSKTEIILHRAISACVSVVIAVTIIQEHASAAVSSVNLGTADNFAILAGTGITINGTPATMRIKGDIGTFPTSTITGLANAQLDGVNHGGDSVTQQAKIDLTAAIADASGRTPTTSVGAIYDFSGSILTSGVYYGSSSIANNGTLTLNGAGDSNAVWIFQAGSTLITSAGSNIVLTGGAQASNVFWQIGTSATLGTNSNFVGTIMATESITLNSGAELVGRAFASNGAVTLSSNIVAIPELGSPIILGMGLLILLMQRRRTSYPDLSIRSLLTHHG